MRKGRAPKIGSHAIATSVMDRQQQPCISCTTFNILAPIYKRLKHHQGESCRESDYRAYWMTRNRRILNWLLFERSSIICLQEFWVGNEELVSMYEKRLGDCGYVTFKLARTNNRGDGLLTALREDCFRIVRQRDLAFEDPWNRVAQLLHVELAGPFSQGACASQGMLIVNTHLLFPHDSSLSLIRLQQAYKILQCVESYQKEMQLSPMPIMLCGDWNGSKRGHLYKFLRSQGFVSSYDTAHRYTDADAHKWISHRNHRGDICGVDFIWLLNPNRYRKLLKTSWSEAVFGLFKFILRRALQTEEAAFAFLKARDEYDHITFSGFCEGLRQLNITGHENGLGDEEVRDLWDRADVDGDGFMDENEFQQRIWNASSPEQGWEDENDIEEDGGDGEREQTVGFCVKNAVLFPAEAEKGMWPENYSLSDHARLTVVFSPVRMPCSRLKF
uniref:EF-hand domain-containing protein n=1 Tax=Kalanchoe fedtschenkoi TaxID=63787 RepID=A0A7N0TCG6_KALFE